MSKFPRETIVLVGAIVGANLLAFVSYSKPVRSLDCFQPFLPKPSEPVKGEPIDSYYDVRTKKDTPYYREGEAPSSQASTQADVPLAAVPIPTPVPANLHPPTAQSRTQGAAPTPSVPPLSFTDAEIDAAIARERQQPGAWVAENRLPNASEQADYQARRQSLLFPRGGI